MSKNLIPDYPKILNPNLSEDELTQIRREWSMLHFPTAPLVRSGFFENPAYRLALLDLFLRVRGKDTNTRDDDQVLALYSGSNEEAYRRRVELGADSHPLGRGPAIVSRGMQANELFRLQVAEAYYFGAKPVLDRIYRTDR